MLRPNTPEADKLARHILPSLIKKGYDVTIDEGSAKRIGYPNLGRPLKTLDVDLLITLGGDGTILHAIHEIPNPDTYILGVNFGYRGVLSEIDPERFDQAWSLIEEGNYTVHTCTQLATEVNGERLIDALNETLITARAPAKIIEVEVFIDCDVIMQGKLDGVIVATTTGSTAYALSAGGPLVHPDLDCFVVVPLFPINFDLRPVVSSAKTPLSIHLTMPQRASLVTIDGQKSYPIKPGSTLEFYPSEVKARFIRIQRRVPRMRMKLMEHE
ncbi:MAG: NAD(+)/NADH kinase [Candidatus Ranarchaeia archaeon]